MVAKVRDDIRKQEQQVDEIMERLSDSVANEVGVQIGEVSPDDWEEFTVAEAKQKLLALLTEARNDGQLLSYKMMRGMFDISASTESRVKWLDSEIDRLSALHKEAGNE